jgi:hypothetical protein
LRVETRQRTIIAATSLLSKTHHPWATLWVKERDLACDPGAGDLSVGKEWRMQGAK